MAQENADDSNVNRSDVMMRQDTSPPSIPKMKQVGVDIHSRDAFELLKLGEAIGNLQADQRKIRLNGEDLRFERDRYRASAAALQEKLNEALNENARLRDLRELIRSLAATTAANSTRQQDIDGLASRLKGAHDQYSQSKAHEEILQAKLTHALNEQQEALAESERSRNEVGRVSAKLAECEKRLAESEAVIVDLEAQREGFANEQRDTLARMERIRRDAGEKHARLIATLEDRETELSQMRNMAQSAKGLQDYQDEIEDFRYGIIKVMRGVLSEIDF